MSGADPNLARLDTGVPLMLAPVRLETRLRGAELLVRIFPDDLHAQSHDPGLTDGEAQQGRRYWTAVWRAGRHDDAAARMAWDQLAGTLGPARARHVARTLAPPVDDRPEQPDPAATPAFPDHAARPAGWGNAATASTLPDVFVARAYQGTLLAGEATGGPVPGTVRIGPDPNPAAGTAPDEGLRWMVDFGEAEASGLAVRVPLDRPGFDPARRPLLSRVIVVGVADSLDATAAAGRVAGLLSGHAAAGTAAFVPQGTPTNNTADGPQPDPPPAADELLHPSVPEDPLVNAVVTAQALGIATAPLAALPGAAEPEQADARALQLALWSATGDYFVDQLLESESQTEELGIDREWLRAHYADHVRARGPLPVLRLGRQPYGILPVTSTRQWQPDADAEAPALAALHEVITTVWPFWRTGVQQVPRIGGPDDDDDTLDLPKPERDVLRALGVAPVSRAAEVRTVRGALNACFINTLLNITDGCRGGVETVISRALNRGLGLRYDPVITHHQNEAKATRLWIPYARLTGDDAVDKLAGFLEDVVERFHVPGLAVGPDQAGTLLEAMLRHAANIEYARAAAAVAHHGGLLARPRLTMPEVLLAPALAPGIAERARVSLKAVTPASTLAMRVATGTVEQTLQADRATLAGSVATAAAKFNGVLKLNVVERPWSARLAEIDAALRYLGERARTWRDRGGDAFTQVERLFGECLDLCSHRLDAWVTAQATARLAAMRESRPTGLQLGAYGWVEDLSPRDEARRSDGHVLAPSIAQATTAAILRSGARAHPSDPGAFAVDLSSHRMRAAMAVLDGVRQGQPLGALLGYRLERRLHDLREEHDVELDRFIAPLRKMAPLAGVLHPGPGAQEVVAAHDVVDGARLADKPVSDVLAGLAPAAAERPHVEAALRALHDDVDALADLLLAESVHQLVNGNPDRAGATLDTLAAGGKAPPRPELLDQPRSGLPVTHRVLIAVPADLPPAPGWSNPAQRARPRAQAEPYLDAWAGHQLGRIGRFRATWSFDARELTTEHDWPLGEHCALDVAALAAAGALRAALAARIPVPPGVPPGTAPVFDWPVSEIEELGRAVAAVLAAGRPGTAADLASASAPPAATPPPGPQPATSLKARADAALDGLRAALNEPGKLEGYGVAAPPLPGADPEEQTAGAVQAGQARVQAAEAARTPQGVLEAVFGSGFRAVEPFTPPDGAALTASFGPGLDRGDARADDWLERMAPVHDATAALADLVLYTAAAGTGHPLRIGQTPFHAGDHWVGTHPAPGTGLAVHGPDGLDFSRPVAVLVVDAWTEVIPAPRHTAGVSFHYDAPGARPPQAVLLAVPPVPGAAWTVDALTSVVGETLDLARLRLVDLRSIGWLGRYLPALYLPQTALGTAPSIDLKQLMRHMVVTGVLAEMLKREG
ncbi:hypothetical protein [Spirillospora sp. CA-128828]|uniref:hypothetical protein n=1 Tax=Spirillospora sp. CA-128828 TaxID=3240033 RepID=UPI003D93EF18